MFWVTKCEMAKIAPVENEKPSRKRMKFMNHEDAISSRYQNVGPKVDVKDEKDRLVLFTLLPFTEFVFLHVNCFLNACVAPIHRNFDRL